MLTHTPNGKTKPIFEKMVISKSRLDITNEETIKILRDILTFNQEDVVIDNESAQLLIHDYPELSEIFDTSHAIPVYRVNQTYILNNINLKWSYDKKQRCLLRLMELSMNPVQACVDQPQLEHTFWKKINSKDT